MTRQQARMHISLSRGAWGMRGGVGRGVGMKGAALVRAGQGLCSMWCGVCQAICGVCALQERSC